MNQSSDEILNQTENEELDLSNHRNDSTDNERTDYNSDILYEQLSKMKPISKSYKTVTSICLNVNMNNQQQQPQQETNTSSIVIPQIEAKSERPPSLPKSSPVIFTKQTTLTYPPSFSSGSPVNGDASPLNKRLSVRFNDFQAARNNEQPNSPEPNNHCAKQNGDHHKRDSFVLTIANSFEQQSAAANDKEQPPRTKLKTSSDFLLTPSFLKTNGCNSTQSLNDDSNQQTTTPISSPQVQTNVLKRNSAIITTLSQPAPSSPILSNNLSSMNNHSNASVPKRVSLSVTDL